MNSTRVSLVAISVHTVAVNKKFTFRIRSTIVVRNHFHSFTKRASLR